MALSQMVLKIASRCNLNCSYCYMYNVGDTTYINQPKVMSDEVVTCILSKVRAYCFEHALSEFDFVFHGGEPMLAGKEFYKNFIRSADLILGKDITYSISIQTNGTLIDEDWSCFFRDYGIYAGISIDGPEDVHDKNRRYHSGKGSFKDVLHGLENLKKYNPINLIAVIDVQSNPTEFYNLIKSLSASRVSIQIEYANYDKPPLGIKNYHLGDYTAYADWLIQLYDLWKKDTDSRPSINILSQIMSLLLGVKDSTSDMLGEKNCDLLIIETDGGIEPSGSLKICGNAFTKQGLNIVNNEIEEALENDLIKSYLNSHSGNLPLKCLQCPVKEVCGGGSLSSRYSESNGFNNPSIFCNDLMKLITYLQNSLIDIFPEDSPVHKLIKKISYQEARELNELHSI
ncbi:radical SAM protein [Chitinophaga sp. 30R24]|uniref:radical SAM protein n=1 Tax=Chitinophaga sp. 30R24 TaxID=3248838 RepID=UPI003B8FDF26